MLTWGPAPQWGQVYFGYASERAGVIEFVCVLLVTHLHYSLDSYFPLEWVSVNCSRCHVHRTCFGHASAHTHTFMKVRRICHISEKHGPSSS